MKDSLLLLAAAIIMAGAGWIFWHYAGQNGPGILLMISTVSLLTDNIRLRRIIKENGLPDKFRR